jgi:hypothetical protein
MSGPKKAVAVPAKLPDGAKLVTVVFALEPSEAPNSRERYLGYSDDPAWIS